MAKEVTEFEAVLSSASKIGSVAVELVKQFMADSNLVGCLKEQKIAKVKIRKPWFR